jgi:hypothetical protein
MTGVERLLFAHGRTLNLGLFRILFACALWIEVSTSLTMDVFAIDGGFHLPYVPFLPRVSEQAYRSIHLAQYPLVGALGLGLFARGACFGLLLLQGYVFFADRMNFRNHPYLFLLLLVLLLAAPAADAVSLSALMRDRFWGTVKPLTFQRLMQVQISIVYFFAGLSKLYPVYLGGSVLAHQLEPALIPRVGPAVAGLLLAPRAMQLASWATVVLELSLPFALWCRRTRPVAIVAGCVLHAAVAWVLDVYTFSLVMIASYLLFLDPEALPRMARRWAQARISTLTS